MAAVARNVPKLVPLAILSIALGLGVGYALLLPALLGGPVAVVLVLGATFLVGVVGFLSIWWIRATPRRQRFGDLLAATVVLQRPAPPPAFPGLTPWATSPMAPGPLP